MTRNPVSDRDDFSAAYWSSILNAHAQEAIVSGCIPTLGTGDWEIDIAAGEAHVGGSIVDVAAQTVTLSNSATEDRVDLVTVDAAGDAAVVEGQPAAPPLAPDIPDGDVLVAVMLVEGGASSLGSAGSELDDYRTIYEASPTFRDVEAESVSTEAVRNRNVVTTREDARSKYLGLGESGPMMDAKHANFEDLTNWTLTNATTDTSDYFVGTQSLKSADGGSWNLSMTFSSVDLTRWLPSIAVKVDTSISTTAQTIAIKIQDGAGNWNQFRRTINPDKHATAWHVIDIGPSSNASNFDLTDVVSIKISPGTNHKIDNLQWVKQPRTGGVVAFIFDDGNASVFDQAFPEFQKRGMPASTAVITSLIGDSGSLSESQIDTLYDAGWTIANHSTVNEPLDGKSESEIRTVVGDAKDELQRRGWLNGATTYVYMGGNYDALAMDVVNDYHELAFSTGSLSTGPVNVRNRNPLALSRPFAAGENVGAIKKQIDIAAAYECFVPISFHTVGGSGDISVSDLGAVLDYADQVGVEVVSLDEVLGYQQTPDEDLLRHWNEKADGTLVGPTVDVQEVRADKLVIKESSRYVASDADLTDALADSSDGDWITLLPATYSDDRTIDTRINFQGSYAGNEGTEIAGEWEINSRGSIQKLSLTGHLIIDDPTTEISGVDGVTSGEITASTGRNRIYACSRLSATFESGTTGNILDSSTGVTVADNGNNTVGDIA